MRDFSNGRAIRDFGKEEFFSRFELKPAAEAISIHVGESLKRLSLMSSIDVYSTGIYKLAMKNRDVVAHNYDQIDHATLWKTLCEDFPELEELIQVRLEKLGCADHGDSTDS